MKKNQFNFIFIIASIISAMIMITNLKGCGSNKKKETLIVEESEPEKTCNGSQLGSYKYEPCGSGYIGNKFFVCQKSGWNELTEKSTCQKQPTQCEENAKGKINFADDIKPKIIDKYCTKCHYTGEKKFSDYTVSKQWADKILVAITRGDDQRMPKKPEPALNPDDQDLFRKWINDGLLEKNECIIVDPKGNPRIHLNEKYIEQNILDDLKIQQEIDQASKRSRNFFYLTLANKYNEGADENSMRYFAGAIKKGINSLSKKDNIIDVPAIDLRQTIYRVDVSDFQFDKLKCYKKGKSAYELSTQVEPNAYPDPKKPDTPTSTPCNIDAIDIFLQNSAFVYESFTDEGLLIKQLTNRKINFASAEDFLFVVLNTSPIYYAITEISANFNDFLEQVGLELQEEIDEEHAIFIGKTDSEIGENNRLIIRYECEGGSLCKENGYFRQTYDVAKPNGNDTKVLLKNPFIKETGSKKIFNFEASETINELPNGLHLYALFNAAGVRQDFAPTTIVVDHVNGKKFKDFEINPALNCMNCHNGLKPQKDEVGSFLNDPNNPSGLDVNDRELARIFYPGEVKVNPAYARDVTNYENALKKLGINISEPEPVNFLVDQFRTNWGQVHFCAFVHKKLDECLSLISASPVLKPELGALLDKNLTISLNGIVDIFQDVIKEFKLGQDPRDD